MTTVAVRHPRAPSPRSDGTTIEPVYVWELPVRLTHWAIALAIGVLAVTGVYIGHPFLLAPGPARDQFVMGWVKAIHSWAAIVFTLSVLARVVWMFAGNRAASWREFIPVERRRRRDIPETLRFYLFMRKQPPEAVGHNPVAGATYTLVFLLYFVQIVTGLVLRAHSTGLGSPLRWFAFFAPWLGGLQTARWIHHVVMWLLIGFVVHHVQSALLVSRAERNGLLDSIFSGWKFMPRRRGGGEQ
jgi:Ni/Fe-hydrogenase 1 B-type cytochrome subunit